MGEATVGGIHIHPIKSCRRIEVGSATITPLGLADDRLWQVVNDQGHPVTQRQHRVLATVQPELIDGGIRVSAPDHGSVEFATPTVNDATVKSLFGVSVEVGDGGDAAATWFSDLVGEPVRIARIIDGGGWSIPEPFGSPGGPMGFTDAAAVLVASASSHAWLAERAAEPFGIERFRPNLIVDGAPAWAEDTWKRFSVAGVEFEMWLPWPRCPIPQIDQDDGERHREPALVLKEHRWCASAGDWTTDASRPIVENNTIFGIGCAVTGVGSVVSVGDSIEVTEHCEPMLAPPID